MTKYKLKFIILALIILTNSIPIASANTWQLDYDQGWKAVSTQTQDEFISAINEAQKLANAGRTKSAKKAFNQIKEEFPEIAGSDLDMFIKAELLLSQKKLSKAAATLNKLLQNYPETALREKALEREFSIGAAFLGGRKRIALGFIPIKGNAEGIRIMEKVTDQAGLDTTIGVNAALAIAENYESREKFNEAYLKWWEISLEWQTNWIGRDALLGMARSKHGIYNKYPEEKRHYYDASCLQSAKSYYEKFRLIYPEDAKEKNVDEILEQISEQLADKELEVARYYLNVGNIESANLYFNAVMTKRPDTKAADIAKSFLSYNNPG